MENRNIRMLVMLVVLLASTMVVYLFQQRDTRAVIDPTLFHIEDPAKIDRIVLTSKTKKVDLHLEGARWKVNDRYDADPQLIDAGGRGIFFATVQQAIAKRPVALHQRDSVNVRLEKFGVTVQLFEGSVLQKQFQVGGNALKTESYFKADKTGEPFLMTIPGYRIYVSQIFELGENGWRDLRIFNFSWRNFKSLTAKFPGDPASDFEISMQGKFFGVAGLEKTDTARVNTFLDDVSLLVADQIVSQGSSKIYDSLAKTVPMSSMSIVDIAGHSYLLDLYAPVTADKIAGKAWDGDIVLFDRKKTFAIFKKRSYFRKK